MDKNSIDTQTFLNKNQKEKTQKFITFSLCRIWGATPSAIERIGQVYTVCKQDGGKDICVATGMTVRCRNDHKRMYWQAVVAHNLVGLQQSYKEGMSHLCYNTVGGPAAKRDNALASRCGTPPFPLTIPL